MRAVGWAGNRLHAVLPPCLRISRQPAIRRPPLPLPLRSRLTHTQSNMAAPAATAASSSSSSNPTTAPHAASTSAAALAKGESVLSLASTSIWAAESGAQSASTSAAAPSPTYPPLQGALSGFDVVIAGAGIVGASAAYECAKAGLKVALLEARDCATGTTGWSTAKLTSQQNLLYTTIASQHGKDTARLYGEMNEEAIARVATLDRELGLQSQLARIPHATWTSTASVVPLVQQEAALCKEIGLPCDLLTPEEVTMDLPASIKPLAALRFNNQATFNPIVYCRGLIAAVSKMPGCSVFERTRVTAVSVSSPHTITCEGGSIDGAKHVVLATHMPILDRSAHFAIMTPSRTVCIAMTLKEPAKLPKMAWISDSSSPMRSMRVSARGELVLAGESFDQGSVTDTNSKYEALEKWAREHFDVAEVTHRWSAMDYVTSTHLPYIGFLHRGCSSLYTATGMSKWGLANGVAAGWIIRDLVLGGEAAFESGKYTRMIDARRWDLIKAGLSVAKASVHTATHMVGDRIKAALASDISSLKPGQGGLCKVKGETVGAYLDTHGAYHLVKPVCTHLGCELLFNQGDKCWSEQETRHGT